MTFFHKLISFQVFDLFLHDLVCLFLVPVPTRASVHAHLTSSLCNTKKSESV